MSSGNEINGAAASADSSATNSSTPMAPKLPPRDLSPSQSVRSEPSSEQSSVSNLPVNLTDVTAKFTKPTDETPSSVKVQSSPLLSSTPPTVSKSLIRAYPYLILLNKVLCVLTWTDDDVYLPVSVVLFTVIFILYFENIVTFFGHVLPVLALALFSVACSYAETQQMLHPTLDDVVHCMSTTSNKCEQLLAPVTSLNLSAYDLKKLLFTAVFLLPLYIIFSFFVVSPKVITCATAVFLLTYHSQWSRVTRRLLWKSRTLRMACFYLTGIDMEKRRQDAGAPTAFFKYALKQTNKTLRDVTASTTGTSSVKFTYVLYENQRRWLGIGWTPNLLSYERTPWTDEFANEAVSIDNFELPPVQGDSGMYWRWVDKTWRVDLTNDGALQLASTKSKTTADPKPDEGFIYYDNTWKGPSTEDSFSKYTRRRRWVRTAEMVSASGRTVTETDVAASPSITSPQSASSVEAIRHSQETTGSAGSATKAKKRKSIRFDSAPTVIVDDTESPKEPNLQSRRASTSPILKKEPSTSPDSIQPQESPLSLASGGSEPEPKKDV